MQTNAASGRLAMGDPSFQTFPKLKEIELTDASGAGGRAVRRSWRFNIRAAVVAPPGCLILAADYKQLELR